ncbi:signal peptidase I [Arthrobacter sp. zg-Y820]|uniref:signal peptidase I n=1 Tax=unclassified Arthrobacter TaxID=235627 RepID=UPI001E2F27D5|nr:MULTISPECIES: signal peptidase I [unclassified Arthrobacter]MCC9198031.1 signal peptidase I [Arthrobacter sp. zg-Y820]MDK1280898.1 signal peptidase I [Arthrobacter sp. zg.Y820]WIB10376.1 signal peptidase I [Arthrobacter sp. zg-Y820]
MSGRRKAEVKASPLSFIGTCVSYIALCLATLAALALVVVPMLTGSQTYSVLTSSMAPKYAPGTFLVVKPIPFEELRIGDVITYQIESGSPAVITHRITAISAEQSGETVFTTKGDNNDVEDELPVREIQVKGKLFYAVPFVGFIANGLGNSDRGAIAQWGAFALMGYGVVALVRGALAKKRNNDDGGSTEGPTEQGPDDDTIFPSFGSSTDSGSDFLEHGDPILTDCDGCDHDHSRENTSTRHRVETRKHATVS